MAGPSLRGDTIPQRRCRSRQAFQRRIRCAKQAMIRSVNKEVRRGVRGQGSVGMDVDVDKGQRAMRCMEKGKIGWKLQNTHISGNEQLRNMARQDSGYISYRSDLEGGPDDNHEINGVSVVSD